MLTNILEIKVVVQMSSCQQYGPSYWNSLKGGTECHHVTRVPKKVPLLATSKAFPLDWKAPVRLVVVVVLVVVAVVGEVIWLPKGLPKGLAQRGVSERTHSTGA